MSEFFKNQKQQRSWGQIFLDLFVVLSTGIKQSVHEKQIEVIRRLSATVLLVIGALFFLIGMALFIGSLINQTAWAGYIVVGIVLAVIGLLVPKK